MKSYALGLKTVTIPRERRKQLDSELTEHELSSLRKATGELSWLSRQLRADLAFDTGFAQRAAESPCVADLVRVNRAINNG